VVCGIPDPQGTWLGFIFGFGGIAGIALGGYVATRWFANDERAQVRLSGITIALLLPCLILFLLLPGKYSALMAMIPLAVAGNFLFGPTFALMQRLVAEEMRATLLAVVMLLANLIGMGIGPQVVGILSDLLMPIAGRDSLRYALLITSFLALWSACHFWRAGRTVREDLAALVESPGTATVASR
jgi:predicted MFS family arabinose efflux permease